MDPPPIPVSNGGTTSNQRRPACELASLPAELLLFIAGFVASAQDLSALSRASRRLYRDLLRHRYRLGVQAHGPSLVTWAIRRRRMGTVRDALDAAAAIAAGRGGGAAAATRCPQCANAPSPLELAAQYNFEDVVALLLGAATAATRDDDRGGGDGGGDEGGGGGEEEAGAGEQEEGEGAEVININVNARSPKGQAALCWAAAHRNAALARMLLRVHGIDLETRDPYGRTPLANAAGHGDMTLVEMLLAHGADANSPLRPVVERGSGGGDSDVDGTTATTTIVVDAAIQAVVSRLLQDRGGCVDDDNDAGRRLLLGLAKDSDVDAGSSGGGNGNESCSVPLLLAVGSGHADVARTLVAHGAHLHLEATAEEGRGGHAGKMEECRCGETYA
ncbi:hypothetical protein JDV02_005488 [Purpureocillium takamizusanense]|uniref:Ankyrin repeat protein n=1 Tax=Purpureocillium takamizusanense TaxID=2060973 RepID=A0A9Q8VAE0_9HYPO|nr:uncharacterized protein JDV02_005488 [Purpureocillium takamizusanense]UNI19295.1 hypothetical protein JDV02_005488 [Purpureocillium takamizusanense]